MVLGILQFELLIPGSESLKDKRRVVRSVKDRLHRAHQASVAEVAALDTLNAAVLAAAVVGADGARVGQVLDRIAEKLRALPDAELGDTSRRILREDEIEARAARQREAIDEEALARELLNHYDAPGPEPTP